jgi:hypothetical protein
VLGNRPGTKVAPSDLPTVSKDIPAGDGVPPGEVASRYRLYSAYCVEKSLNAFRTKPTRLRFSIWPRVGQGWPNWLRKAGSFPPRPPPLEQSDRHE